MLTDQSKALLRAVFGARWGEATIVWWQFQPGTRLVDINTVRSARAKDIKSIPHDHAVYFSSALWGGTGKWNDKGKTFLSAHCFVLDDVGTKVPDAAVADFTALMPPTRVVESSKGNKQLIYGCPEGWTDDDRKALWAGMSDRIGYPLEGNTHGNLFRLPQGVNGKYDAPTKDFPVRWLADGPGYKASEVLAFAKKDMAIAVKPASPPSPEALKAPSLGLLELAMKAIPNDDTFDAYIKVEHGKSDAYGVWTVAAHAFRGAGGDPAEPFWIEWCEKRKDAQKRNLEKAWGKDFAHSRELGWPSVEKWWKHFDQDGWAKATAPGVFDDGAAPPPGDDVALMRGFFGMGDYWAHLPSGKFILECTGALVLKESVNDTVSSGVTSGPNNTPVPASRVLRQTRPIHQISWIPGAPTIVRDTAVQAGGVMTVSAHHVFNTYRPPMFWASGDAQATLPWVAHVQKMYPTDWEHILDWFAHRVQRPGEKVNHALVIGGAPGIGKDVMLEALKWGVGQDNFADITPKALTERFGTWKQSVVLRVNEAHDLGEMNRVSFYEVTKTVIAAPPHALSVERKGIDAYMVPNVTGVIITTNHKLTGLYLPPDDRRHYVAWSNMTAADMGGAVYFDKLVAWLDAGSTPTAPGQGTKNVIAFLKARDLSRFNPKAPPVQTRAFQAIAAVSRGSNDEDVANALLAMGEPDAFSWNDFKAVAAGAILDMIKAGKDRLLAAKLGEEGYERVPNPANQKGTWRVGNSGVSIYAKKKLPVAEQLKKASDLANKKAAKVKNDNDTF